MEVGMHAPGLWTWSVGDATCLYHEAPDGIVVADPLAPDDEAERFWRALDRDVERIGRPPTVVVSAVATRRSADTVRSRYSGAMIHAPWGPTGGERTETLEDGGLLPGGLTAIVYGEAAMLLCACHGLIWTGDLLHGVAPDDLRPGPSLAALSTAERGALATRLTAADPTIVVPAVGPPVGEDPARAISRALA
jgi:hypothetical protein